MPATEMRTGTAELTVRSKTILLFYLIAALLSFVRSALGPCMPFLRQELGFSYTVAAYHFSALSIGIIIAGSTGDKIIPRLGRHKAIWLGFFGVACGLGLVMGVHAVPGTILGVLLMGLCSAFIGQCMDSTITEHLAHRRTIAIAEVNIVASLSCMAAPAALGAVVGAGVNWRIPLLIALVGFAITFFRCRNVTVPLPASGNHQSGDMHLGPAYWAYWCVVLLSCAAEWSIIFWSVEFLIRAGHMAQAAACSAVSAFFIAMLCGRLVGTRLATTYDTTRLLPIFGFVALAGFLVFWLSHSVPFMVAGLAVAGLGISNLYPYTVSAALGINPKAAPRATSRMGIAGGASGLFGPLLPGCLADRHGIATAYAAVAALLAGTLVMIVVANRISSRRGEVANEVVAIAP